jgi:hypothetical protein
MMLSSPVVLVLWFFPSTRAHIEVLEATSMGYYKRTVEREKLLHKFVSCIV